MVVQPYEVDTFLGAALPGRNFVHCAALIGQLRERGVREPDCEAWARYLEALLLSERDQNPGGTERALHELARGPLPPLLSARINLALGVMLQYRGAWREGINAYQQALERFTAMGREVDRAKVCKQLAIIHNEGYNHGAHDQRMLGEALAWARRAMAILDGLPERSPALDQLRGTVWNTLGLINRNLGQLDEAAACYERDLELLRASEENQDPARPVSHSVAVSLLNLGEIHQRRGPAGWDEARRHYLQALLAFRAHKDDYNSIDVLANLGTLAQARGDRRLALRFYRRAIASIERLRVGITDEEARAGVFATMITTFDNAVLLCLELGDAEQAFALAERSRGRAMRDRLAVGASLLPGAYERAPLSPAALKAQLGPDAALLAYYNTGLTELRVSRRAVHSLPPRHRSATEGTVLFLVGAERIEAMVLKDFSPNSLRPGDLRTIVEGHLLAPELRRRLYQALVAPVEARLRGLRTLYILPHGPLHYVPFQALIAGDGETLLREAGPNLIFELNGATLAGPARRGEGPPSEGCLVVGYNGAADERLRFAEDEARQVARQLGGTALVGAGLKKGSFLARAGRHRLIHVCGHAAFRGDSPQDSLLQLGPDEALYAHEVTESLRLRCSLVTLSACESGLSTVRSGDELYGLARAFLVAGTAAILCPLWRVDDRSTRLLMQLFYDGVLEGLSFGEALRRSQLRLRSLTAGEAADLLGDKAPGGEARPFAEPYYWAPFILIGQDARLTPGD